MKALLSLLQEPEIRGFAVDSDDRMKAHKTILSRKKMIRDVFVDIHHTMREMDMRYLSGSGARIELGSGVFPLKESFPDVLATDVVHSENLDRTLDACNMKLESETVRCFYLQNSFHHFPDPQDFLSEVSRTLVPGGGVVIVDPHYGPLASWLYPRLFETETFDKNANSWCSEISGPMSGANQALSYIVFDRDEDQFKAKNPGLTIVHKDVLTTWPRYLLSGGLNFRSLLPGALNPVLAGMERLISPTRNILGLHRVVVIRKNG